MNKMKRLGLFLRGKTLRFWKFLDDEKYRDISCRYFEDCGVVFHGKPKYINYDVDFDLTKSGLIHIGENTVVAKGSIFLTHDYSIECGLIAIGESVSDYEMQFLKEIHVGRDCFIGARAFVLPGTNIGNNCIIGAGSVVSGNIPDNCIYAGNPARFVMHTDEWAKKKLENKQFVKGTKKRHISKDLLQTTDNCKTVK